MREVLGLLREGKDLNSKKLLDLVKMTQPAGGRRVYL
jgi:hypothetical protein